MHSILLQVKTPHLWDLLFGDPGRITRRAFENILTEVYIAGAIIAIFFLLFAIFISNSINYETGVAPKDPQKRRIVFYVLGILAIITLFAISTFSVTELSKMQEEQFKRTSFIAIGINALIYFVGGFALSKIFSNKKLGSWFPSRENG